MITTYQPERGSSTLNWLSEYLTREIADLRKKNDTDLDPEKTAKLRGHIQALLVLESRIKPFVS
jgi:hypothetical protein